MAAELCLPNLQKLLGLSLSLMCLSGAAFAQEKEQRVPPESQVYESAEVESQEFNIAPQPLESALQAFARTTGLQLNYPSGLTQGKFTSGLSGAYTPAQALRVLLAGTGLTYRFTAVDTVTLARAAQDEEGPVQLDPVTATARRVETPISNIPGSVSVLEEEEIQDQIALSRDLAQVLNRTVPGFSQDDPPEGPLLRGRRALVLINGAPVNQFLRGGSGIDLEAIPPEAIERVEVARGASAAYGFGAPGGIISITTRRSRSEELLLTSRASASFNVKSTTTNLKLVVW
jgi:outer membrane receptor protein involved in Fe transport